MAFLRSGTGFDDAVRIRGQGVYLRPPAASDYAAWAELRAQSRAHLTRWEPQWSNDELTRSSYKLRLRFYAREAREDLGYAYFVFRSADDVLIGGLTLSNVRRGVAQSASIGYWMGLPHVRRGYMKAATHAAVHYGFEAMCLHRIEAACMPGNTASIAVLTSCGFTREGFARKYLKIDGVWQDHLLFAKLASDVDGARAGGTG
jgi:ribosomal-protein-alanine N-acetyltransferase